MCICVYLYVVCVHGCVLPCAMCALVSMYLCVCVHMDDCVHMYFQRVGGKNDSQNFQRELKEMLTNSNTSYSMTVRFRDLLLFCFEFFCVA